MNFDITAFDVKKFDSILSRGLSQGLGDRGKQVCIEAAICEAMNLPHSDDPKCVSKAVRSFKISLNDSSWSNPQARAEGLRDLGLAQLGSLGVVDDVTFATKLAEKTIRILIPTLFRTLFPGNPALLAAAQRCEDEGTVDAARAARAASYAARYASYAASEASDAARVASDASDASDADAFLKLSAQLAMETLRELNAPGLALLEK